MMALDVGLALVARLERDLEVAGVGRGVERADADDRDDAGRRPGPCGWRRRPASCSRCISAKETSGPASVTAVTRPVSCSGRKPFGTTT